MILYPRVWIQKRGYMLRYHAPRASLHYHSSGYAPTPAEVTMRPLWARPGATVFPNTRRLGILRAWWPLFASFLSWVFPEMVFVWPLPWDQFASHKLKCCYFPHTANLFIIPSLAWKYKHLSISEFILILFWTLFEFLDFLLASFAYFNILDPLF